MSAARRSVVRRSLDCLKAVTVVGALAAVPTGTASAAPIAGCDQFVCLFVSQASPAPGQPGVWLTNGIGTLTLLAPAISQAKEIIPFWFFGPCTPTIDCGGATPSYLTAGHSAGDVINFDLSNFFLPGGAVPGTFWRYDGILVYDQNDRQLANSDITLAPLTTTTPEPATLGLLAAGLGAIGFVVFIILMSE